MTMIAMLRGQRRTRYLLTYLFFAQIITCQYEWGEKSVIRGYDFRKETEDYSGEYNSKHMGVKRRNSGGKELGYRNEAWKRPACCGKNRNSMATTIAGMETHGSEAVWNANNFARHQPIVDFSS